MERASPSLQSHWTYILFVKHPELFLPPLTLRIDRTEAETSGLQRIFEESRLSKGSKILDLMCGIGRHLIHLAKRGHEVVGFDLSPFYGTKPGG